MEDVRNSIPWKKPFIPETGKEESNTNRKPERAVEISNHLHFFQAIIFQILNVCDEMQYVKRRTCSTEIEENAKLSTTTILGLEEYAHASYLSQAPQAVPVEKNSAMWRNLALTWRKIEQKILPVEKKGQI